MTREIRLPAPHPRFRPRLEGEGRRPGHPGTAVRIGEDLFEVVGVENSGGHWVYRLEPWTGQSAVRVYVEWGERAEREFSDALREDRILEQKRLLAWGTQAWLGFLPAKHQENLHQSIGLIPVRATLWSAILETAASVPFAFWFLINTFAGGMGILGGYIPAWAGILAVAAAAEGLFRLVAVISTGEPIGSFPLALLGLRLKADDRDEVMVDDISVIGGVLNVVSPVSKVWWERAGGVEYRGESYILAGSGRDGTAFSYRFRKGGEGFPVLDPGREFIRNRSADRSFVFAPLWGFLPPSLQTALEFYGRYRPRPYVALSITINFLIAFAIMGPGLKSVFLGVIRPWDILCFAAAVPLFAESILRLLRLLEGATTGSFLAVLVKPVYYMAIKDADRDRKDHD